MSNSETPRGGNSLGFILGILFGLAVGVIVALLFAPQSGNEMREKLAKQSELIRQRYDDAVAAGRETAQEAQEEVLASMKQ
jgi:gas vesicle protein